MRRRSAHYISPDEATLFRQHEAECAITSRPFIDGAPYACLQYERMRVLRVVRVTFMIPVYALCYSARYGEV